MFLLVLKRPTLIIKGVFLGLLRLVQLVFNGGVLLEQPFCLSVYPILVEGKLKGHISCGLGTNSKKGWKEQNCIFENVIENCSGYLVFAFNQSSTSPYLFLFYTYYYIFLGFFHDDMLPPS